MRFHGAKGVRWLSAGIATAFCLAFLGPAAVPALAVPPTSPDYRADAGTIPGLASVTEVIVSGYTSSVDDPEIPCLGSQGYKTAWFTYTPGDYGLLVADTDTGSTNYDTAVAVWTELAGGALHNVTSACATAEDGLASVVWVSHPGTTYYIEVASVDGAGSYLKLWLHACSPLPLPPESPGICAYPGPETLTEPACVVGIPLGSRP